MTPTAGLVADAICCGARVRYGRRVGTAVMPWLDGKWAVQFPHHPRGSYTLLAASRLTVIGKGKAS